MMTKFRSLMYREMRICRKGNILRAVLLIFFVGMMWAMLLILRFAPAENPKDVETALISMMRDMAIMYTAVICIMPGIGQDEVFKSDLNAGWMRYSYALSITPFDRALVRIVRLSIMTGAGMVAANINIIGYCAFTDSPFRIGYVTVQFLVLDLLLITMIISEFFVLAARSIDEMKKLSNRAASVQLGLMIIPCIVFIRKIFSMLKMPDDASTEEYLAEFDIFEKLTGNMLLWLIPLTLLLIAVHFTVIYYRFRFAYGISTRVKEKESEAIASISAVHNEPTGFLYKEIRQNMFGIIGITVLPFLLTILRFLMAAATCLVNPELINTSIIETAAGNILSFVMMGIGFFIASGLIAGVFQGDDRKLWAYFTVSTPTGVKGFIYYKYVLCFAMNGLYMVSCIFNDNIISTISYAASGKEASGNNGVFPVIFFVILFACAIDIPFIVRYGAKKGNTIKLWFMMSVATLATVGFALLPENISDMIMEVLMKLYNGEANDALTLFVSFCPLIVLAAYIFSYKISCRLYMKGVDQYDK